MSKLAVLFPGQGSQSAGMLDDLAEGYPVVGELLARASAVLGYDLADIIKNNPDEKLNQTEYTQPALLVAGVAAWSVLQQVASPQPVFAAGHSLGEYTAMVCSGVLDFEAGVKLVQTRARFMQQAVPPGVGAMAAILGLDNDALKTICDEQSQGQVVAPVNFNAPGQTVIAGNVDAVDRAIASAKENGAKRAIKLAVSVPSHCALLLPAAEQMKSVLAEVSFSTAKFPVVHNVDVSVASSAEDYRRVLAEQLYQPVRWTDTIEYLAAQGVDTLLELGPGKVLCGLNKRIDKTMKALPVFNQVTLTKALEVLNGS